MSASLSRKYLLRVVAHDDVKQFYENKHGYSSDSGFDVYMRGIEKDLDAGWTLGIKLHLGIRCEMLDMSTPEQRNVGFYLYPRSSISSTPLRMSNSVGIIDAGYRGELIAAVDAYAPRDTFYRLEPGMRLFQICAPDLSPFEVEFVDELSRSERGSRGFGSTGRT